VVATSNAVKTSTTVFCHGAVDEVEQAVQLVAGNAAVGQPEIDERDRTIAKPAMFCLDRSDRDFSASPVLRARGRAVRDLRGLEQMMLRAARPRSRRVDRRRGRIACERRLKLRLHEDHVVVGVRGEKQSVRVLERRSARVDVVSASEQDHEAKPPAHRRILR
jgi:hypothetical protein